MATEIEYVEAATGKVIHKTLQDPPQSFFEVIQSAEWTDKQIEVFIDRLNVSADAKAQLAAFARVTLKVGKEVVRIGRKILDVLFAFLRSFPAMGFATIFSLIVGALISAIPLIGAVLGPIALTLGPALGLIFGASIDLRHPEFATRLDAFVAQLRPLAT
jgi:hypothetical protein